MPYTFQVLFRITQPFPRPLTFLLGIPEVFFCLIQVNLVFFLPSHQFMLTMSILQVVCDRRSLHSLLGGRLDPSAGSEKR